MWLYRNVVIENRVSNWLDVILRINTICNNDYEYVFTANGYVKIKGDIFIN